VSAADPLDLDALLAVAVSAARAGGEIVAQSFDDPPVARSKAVGDWVSDVDTSSERAVRAILTEAAPAIPVFGEEEGGRRAALGWLVDPLDGTTNFLHGYPEYAVSIGVLVDGVLSAGVVLDVPAHECFTATAGGGARLNGAPIGVSTIDNPQRALFGTGFPFVRHEEIAPYVAQLARVMAGAAGVRRAGAAALDLASVACGRFEGFWEMQLSPWDIAAGMLLVREAGGVVTTFEGAECPVARTGVVAGSAAMHRWLLRTVNNT
jgi:myo-inositol-1(or 4)-monophosphatase